MLPIRQHYYGPTLSDLGLQLATDSADFLNSHCLEVMEHSRWDACTKQEITCQP